MKNRHSSHALLALTVQYINIFLINNIGISKLTSLRRPARLGHSGGESKDKSFSIERSNLNAYNFVFEMRTFSPERLVIK